MTSHKLMKLIIYAVSGLSLGGLSFSTNPVQAGMSGVPQKFTQDSGNGQIQKVYTQTCHYHRHLHRQGPYTYGHVHQHCHVVTSIGVNGHHK